MPRRRRQPLSSRQLRSLLGLCAFAVLVLISGCLRRAAEPPGPDRPAAEQPTTPGTPASEPEEEDDPGVVFQPRPPRFQTDGLRLATLNAEFLFDGTGDEGQADFPWKNDPAAARAHRDSVARIIRLLDADVLVLPEVENLETLQLLVRESLSDLGYTPYLVDGTDRFTGQDIGLLSRVPVAEVGRTDERAPVEGGRSDYGVSKNLWARLDLGGVPTTVIGVHFLARPDDEGRKPQREAQAEVIRRLVAQELAAGRAVAVLGDFNDFDPDTPDRAGSAPITDVLARIKAAGPGPEDDLRNVLGEAPRRRRFTSFYDRNDNEAFEEGEFSAIDHVLLSPQLYRAVREVDYVHAHDPRLVTDHFPIVVTLGL